MFGIKFSRIFYFTVSLLVFGNPAASTHPTEQPTALGTYVVPRELECVTNCSRPTHNLTNDTCLYVEIIDTFGDGWPNGTHLYYWAQINDEDTNVVNASLDCNCTMMAGCIHPSDLNVNQLFHMTVVATDAEGVVFVPEYAWEVVWTVQAIERGVWKDKYYGGYNSSFVFEYDRVPESYTLTWWENLWAYPEACSLCVDAGSVAGKGLTFHEYLTGVVHMGESSVGHYGLNASASLDYLHPAWYVIGASKTVLHGYGEPVCVDPTDESGYVFNMSSCLHLMDGEYELRTTGPCGGHAPQDVSWSFCGVSGGSPYYLSFRIEGGECVAGVHGNVKSVCDVATQGSEPSTTPSPVFPATSPTPIPQTITTPVPSASTVLEPTHLPTVLGTYVVPRELECVTNCSRPTHNLTNDTCLYVEIIDTFGDGWPNGTHLYYWAQINDEDTNVVNASLDCNCTMMAGCIHPSDLNVNQLFHMTVVATDAEGVVFVPEYAWEVVWTVQAIERGVWKDKYYGGYNSSFVFEYDRVPESYTLTWWENLWAYPEACSLCVDAGSVVGKGLTFHEYLTGVVHMGESSVGHYGLNASASLDYLHPAWYVIGASKTVLHGYGEPVCVDPTDESGYVFNMSSCLHLMDGEYELRTTGPCGGHAPQDVSWSFCGVSGGSPYYLSFRIEGGECVAGCSWKREVGV